MTEKAMSETAMLAGLRDIRLPAEAAGGWPADLAAAVALAGFAALLVGWAVLLVSSAQARTRPRDLQYEISDLAALPDDDRRIALLHLLKDRAPDRFAALQEGLYRPEGGPDAARLQAEVARLF